MTPTPCQRPAPPRLRRAIELFNRGAFWECHEVLEQEWLDEPGEVRRFYQGIIMIAGGFYHHGRRNRAGALSLLGKGAAYAAPFTPTCCGVDVTRLVEDAHAARAWMETLPAAPHTPWPPLPAAMTPRILMTTAD